MGPKKQYPRPSMDPHEDWLSNQQDSQPSTDGHGDWLTQQSSVANNLAKETRELKEENVMLRENVREAQERATDGDREKTELLEQVVKLRERAEQLERAFDDNKKL